MKSEKGVWADFPSTGKIDRQPDSVRLTFDGQFCQGGAVSDDGPTGPGQGDSSPGNQPGKGAAYRFGLYAKVIGDFSAYHGYRDLKVVRRALAGQGQQFNQKGRDPALGGTLPPGR